WVRLKLELHVGCETVHALAEIDGLGRHEHPNACRRHDHSSTFSAFSTSASVLASAAPRMRTQAPPTLISIELSPAPSGRAAGGVTMLGPGPSIKTGANDGSGDDGRVASIRAIASARTFLRQPNSCC